MSIRIANAPVSWGIYEFDAIEQKYTPTQFLDELVATGYSGLELGPWGFLSTDPAVLRPELEQRNLQLLSSYVPVELANRDAHAAGEAHALKVGKLLAELGAVAVVLADNNGTDPELIKQAGKRSGSILSADEWDIFAEGVNRIAHTLHDETGLKIAFHHHCAGHVETAEETRNLMDRVDDELVGLCLDTGHWHYAGGFALQCLDEYGERVRYLHLKDCDPAIRLKAIADDLDYFEATQAGVFCELGQGGVDFPEVLKRMEALGYDGWAVVEQDIITEDIAAPQASARRNRDYLEGLGY